MANREFAFDFFIFLPVCILQYAEHRDLVQSNTLSRAQAPHEVHVKQLTKAGKDVTRKG